MRKIGILLGVAACGGSLCAHVLKVAAGPAVDGRLDEACWAEAKWEGGFTKFANQLVNREVSRETSFAVVADERNVYFGVRCQEPKTDALKKLPVLSPWVADGVEIFVCPTGKSFDFYHFVVPYDARVETVQRFASEGGVISPDSYGAPWKAARADTADGWTAEVAIPLASLYMTRNADWRTDWRVNVARSVQLTGERLTWSPLQAGYNEPEAFRFLKGFPMRAAADDVGMTDVAAEIAGRRDGKLVGTLSFKARVAEGGAFAVVSPAVPPTTVTLKPGVNAVKVPCAFASNGRHLTALALVRKATGARHSRTCPVLVDFEDIRVRLTSPEYRDNFYPGQDSSAVRGSVRTAGGGAVRLTLEGPGIPKAERTLEADGDFAFETPGFAVGEAFLTVEAGGAKKTVKIRKLAPTGRRMAWISKGRLVVDGRPVLRRNVYALGFRGGKAFDERFNADTNLCLTTEVTSGGTLEPGRVIRGLEAKEATRDVRPCPEYFAKLDALVESNRDRDFVYYYISDEPECRNVSPVYLRHVYEYMKEKDPYHVILSASRGGKKYIDCLDWVETHPYLNPTDDGSGRRRYQNAMNQLGSYLDAFEAWDRPDKCVGFPPTMFAYRFQSLLNDYPTFEEYVCHVWAAMMRGGKTLFPYAYHDMGDRAALYEGNRYVNASFAALQDFILDGRRTTLLKTPDAECVRWDLADGEALFVLVNMTAERREVSVAGLPEDFAEFRGARRFRGKGKSFALKPLEVVIGTTKPRDAGLPTFAETKALIDREEFARTHRDNQLLEKYTQIAYASCVTSKNFYKLIDGIRDMYAWHQSNSPDPFVEFSFPERPVSFSKVRVYGDGIEGMNVSVRSGGAWVKLVPRGVKTGKWMRELDFGEVATTVKMRISFSDGKKVVRNVELYEIEVPFVKEGEAKAAAAGRAARTAGADAAADAAEAPVEALWTLDGANAAWQEGYTTQAWFGKAIDAVKPRADGGFTVSDRVCRIVEVDPAYPWVELEVDSFKASDDGSKPVYHAWSLHVGKFGGVVGTVTHPVTGLYTVRLPAFGAAQTVPLSFFDYNFDIGVKRLRNVKRPPNCLSATVAGAPETAKAGDEIRIELTLEKPCEDVSAAFFCDEGRGGGMQGYAVNGMNAIELRSADAAGRRWTATIPIRSCVKAKARSVYVKCTTLGGGVPTPIFTNFACAFE